MFAFFNYEDDEEDGVVAASLLRVYSYLCPSSVALAQFFLHPSVAPRLGCSVRCPQRIGKEISAEDSGHYSKQSPVRCSHSNKHPHCFFGLSNGNRITSRMDSAPVSNIVSRSIPMPIPPAGGMPCSSASRNSSSIFCFSSPACSSKR